MRKSDLQFIQDTMVMQRLFHEPSLHKTAQDGLGDIMSGISGHVKELYDPNNPVESILAFVGPGLLWMLGFRWIAVLYEVAAALGFDWGHFFASIKEKLRPLIGDLVEGKSKDSSAISNIVQESTMGAFGSGVDTDKLQDVVEKYQSLNNLLYMKKFAQRYGKDNALKAKIEQLLAGATGNRMRKGISGFIIRVMSWLLSAVLISVGFAVGGGIASKILGINKKKEDGSGGEAHSENRNISDTSHSNKKEVALYLNPKADASFYTTTYNDNNHVWLLNMNIGSIKNKMIEWAQELYPQLNDKSAFESSSKFNDRLKMFQNRNKDATQLEILAVPPPFKSIKEIVDSFAADVAANMS